MSFFEIMKGINIANKLTVLRILLVPVFVIFLVADSLPHNYTIALAVFAIASITDFLDGHIARTRSMVTELGKFLDPIADKILVMSALVCFAGLGWISGWVVVVVLARDFIISGVRLVAVQSDEKVVIPARTSGKVKTVITMLAICTILLLWILEGYGVILKEIALSNTGITEWGVEFTDSTVFKRPDLIIKPISNALMYIVAAVTVFSGFQYIWDARGILEKQLIQD